MFSSILTIFKQINHLQYSHCVNNIYFNNNQYSYCQKSGQLNNVKVQNDIVLAHKNNNVNLYIYANRTQQATMESQVFNYNIKTFAIFGFNNRQEIHDSQINMSLKFDVLQGALICIQCDVFVHNCTLVFVARGQQVSGVLIESLANIQIMQSFVQFRHASGNSSGIVNTVNNAMDNFTIAHCKLTGHNIITSPFNGYISSAVLTHVVVNVTDFYVCAGYTDMLGQLSVTITQNGSEVERCDICGSLYYVYGLCVDSIQYGTLANGTMQCVYPFEYANDKCECAYGHLRNGSACINLIDAIENQQNTETLLNNISSQFKAADQNLVSNISALNQRIFNNVTQLLDMMKQNSSALEQYILSNFSKAEQFLISNTTAMDNRIRDNISEIQRNTQIVFTQLEQQLNSNYSYLDYNIYQNISILDQQIAEQVNLTRSYINSNISALENYLLLNYSKAEQSIISNYSSLNENIRDNFTQLQNTIDTNSISLNNSIMNNTSIIDVRLYNNITALNQTIQANISSIQQIQSNISKNISVFDDKLNTTIENFDDVFNYLYVQLNNLTDNIYCLNNYGNIINETCFTTSELNSSEQQCKQYVFFFIFDIEQISYTVSSSSGEYIFNSETIIQNAFIDLVDNVYTNITPLFQTQNNFLNVKIQIGNQNTASGSSLLTLSQNITIQQLIIMSKINSEILINLNGWLNILMDYSNISSINNLLINLNIPICSVNIALIAFSQNLNLSNYQLLGNYQSSKSVCTIKNVAYQSIIRLQNINFRPTIFNVGRSSSYFISYTSISTILIDNAAIIIGNKTLNSILSQIYSQYQNNMLEFGGLIYKIQNDSQIQIRNIFIDCYQIIITDYVWYAGILIGQALSNQNSIHIDKICLYSNIQGTYKSVYNFGLIGQNYGNLCIQQSVLTFAMQGLNVRIDYLGIIGIQIQDINLLQTNSSILNSSIVLEFNLTDGDNVGLMGSSNSSNVTISNTILSNSQVSGTNCIGMVGYAASQNITLLNISIFKNILTGKSRYVASIFGACHTNIAISNSSIYQSNISGENYIGGLIGRSYKSNITMSNTIISHIVIVYPKQWDSKNNGIVIGDSENTVFTINQSKSNNNYINNKLLTNCEDITNNVSETQCN
ncbi:Conserved_hypothetical protein [Hexamita inflata]|uniref:Uncharacterized protein n=1 Tax=Hexamita inflata TaxID=28002 RepID=A0ABP1HC00_9EUKA